VSLDRHSESLEVLNQKFTETPMQASLILRMGSGKVAPFLLGGPGWYRRTVEPLNGAADLAVSTTEFGWHGGVGLEVLATRHFGIHGDYRYTFLDFGDDDDGDDDGGIIGGLLPGHRGSMWTLGATFYF
jgi:opacity protein-like surface antigen